MSEYVRDRWLAASERAKNAFIYGLVTTIMLTASIFTVSAFLGAENQKLAQRVDHNAEVAVRATDSIICILGLGVGPDAKPRTETNVKVCLEKNGYVDIATIRPGESP
jgi:hypothetical protein